MKCPECFQRMTYRGGAEFVCPDGHTFRPTDDQLARLDTRIVRKANAVPGWFDELIGVCTEINDHADYLIHVPDADPDTIPDEDDLTFLLALPSAYTSRHVLAWNAWRQELADAMEREHPLNLDALTLELEALMEAA